MNVAPGKNILLADDDEDHGILFKVILKKVDPMAEIRIVHDGASLLESLKESRPDILFLDLNMPCKNGFQCLQEIRNSELLADLPVVVYSSSSQMSDIQRCFVQQADLYMVKPFNANHLVTALESVLNINWQESNAIKRHYYINNRFVPFTA